MAVIIANIWIKIFTLPLIIEKVEIKEIKMSV